MAYIADAYWQDKHPVVVAYIDSSKVFDVMSHNKCVTLQSYGICGTLLSWNILGPLMFLAYINDYELAEVLEKYGLQ